MGRRLVGSLMFLGVAGHLFEIAGRLAAGQRSGWGWFLLAGLAMAGVAHNLWTWEIAPLGCRRCGKTWTPHELE